MFIFFSFPPPLPPNKATLLGGGYQSTQEGLLWDLHWDPSPSSPENRGAQHPGGGVKRTLTGLSPLGDREVLVVADQATGRSGTRHSSAGKRSSLPVFIYFWNALPSKSDQVGCKMLLW